MVYDNKIKCLDYEEEHTHEEVDTLIPNQMLRSLDEHLSQEICVSSPDTDILVLLLDLVSRGRHGNLNSLKFLTGKGANYREIDSVSPSDWNTQVSRSDWIAPFYRSRLGRKISLYHKEDLDESLHGTQ